MRLTYYSDYALRCLIYLATKPDVEKLSNISDIAESYQISKSHLTKIIHHLGKLGYIDSVRGKNGGIRLGIAPADINIGALVRKTESDFQIVDCFPEDSLPVLEKSLDDDKKIELINMVNKLEEGARCTIAPACQLKWVLAKAMQAFISVLDNYTLADVVGNKDDLAELLAIDNTKEQKDLH